MNSSSRSGSIIHQKPQHQACQVEKCEQALESNRVAFASLLKLESSTPEETTRIQMSSLRECLNTTEQGLRAGIRQINMLN